MPQPRHILIDSGKRLVPILSSTAVRIRPANMDWCVFVQAWTNGAIPGRYWVPTEMRIVYDALVLKLEDKKAKTVRMTSLLAWFEDRIAEMLNIAWRGEYKDRLARAKTSWVKDLAEVCASAVAVSLPEKKA